MSIQKRDWLLNTQASLAALRPLVIERKERLSSDDFLKFHYSANWPVIIEHAFDDWIALKQWSLRYFRARFGERVVETQAGRSHDPNYEQNSANLRASVPFNVILDHIASGPSNDMYLTARNNEANGHTLAELWEDIGPLAEYLKPQTHRTGFFWFGPAGTITPFHHDLTNNFMAQVMGRKRVQMMPAIAAPNVYNSNYVYSDVDGRAIDYEKFPLMRNATVMECEIRPGDLLFVPIAWWHWVEALDVSATMTFTNFKWRNDFYNSYQN